MTRISSWGPVLGLLGALVVFVILFLLAPAPEPPIPTPPATGTRTEDGGRPTVVGETATATATVTPILLMTVTPKPTATATRTEDGGQRTETPAVTATPTVNFVPVCRSGMVTAHAAIEAVLENRPERRCEGCIYYASVMCQDIGKRFDLEMGGIRLRVVAVDCASWTIGRWPQKAGADWLGELDLRSWPAGIPLAPMPATLCETATQ